jgi:hypothetical protein
MVHVGACSGQNDDGLNYSFKLHSDNFISTGQPKQFQAVLPRDEVGIFH